MNRNTSRLGPRGRWLALLAVIALLAVSCGSDDGGGDDAAADADAADTTAADDDDAEDVPDADGVIRMVIAPDPVWDWLRDQGIREEMEQEAGMTILDSATWDEFGVYAGGHADVVSAAAYEVPELEEATGIPTTVFGRYNADRSILAVNPELADSVEDICDLEGETIVSLSAVSITIMWGVFAQEECGLELSAEGGDYDLVITDIQTMAGLVASGDASACFCLPDFSVKELRNGDIVPVYDSRSLAQIFAEDYGDGHRGPQTNVFLAPTVWVENNQEEAAFMLSVWERGLEEWRENRDEIIETYPQHFAVEGEEDIEFIQNWFDEQFDWFEETVYLDESWVEGESLVFTLMQGTGFIGQGASLPEFLILEPPS